MFCSVPLVSNYCTSEISNAPSGLLPVSMASVSAVKIMLLLIGRACASKIMESSSSSSVFSWDVAMGRGGTSGCSFLPCGWFLLSCFFFKILGRFIVMDVYSRKKVRIVIHTLKLSSYFHYLLLSLLFSSHVNTSIKLFRIVFPQLHQLSANTVSFVLKTRRHHTYFIAASVSLRLSSSASAEETCLTNCAITLVLPLVSLIQRCIYRIILRNKQKLNHIQRYVPLYAHFSLLVCMMCISLCVYVYVCLCVCVCVYVCPTEI